MNIKSHSMGIVFLLVFLSFGVSLAKDLNPKEQLGKILFFDENLSLNRNQSCAACHGPEVGWTGPNENINNHGAVYEASGTGPVRKSETTKCSLCNSFSSSLL